MKKLIYFLVIGLVVVFSSCSNKKSNKVETMPPLAVEIPAEIQDNPEVVKFIRASEKSINEFANKIETFYIKNPELLSKEAEEMSMVEKLKVMKVAGEMAIAFGEFSMHYAEMNSKMENLEAVMDEEQVAAMATVGEAFEKRMKLLELRLENIKSLN
ncbi:MAG: hypothetical protein PF436_14350 [Prolixibacteraceae bacterium]|jgi:hypothetical protein|nr:hypothetical protein [Prolixibacteraceae bacterium]